jgi:hypothetical protein
MPQRQGAEVHAYADAFGRWHAKIRIMVPHGAACTWSAVDMYRAARRKMLAELRERDANVRAVRVRTVIEESTPESMHIREVAN